MISLAFIASWFTFGWSWSNPIVKFLSHIVKVLHLNIWNCSLYMIKGKPIIKINLEKFCKKLILTPSSLPLPSVQFHSNCIPIIRLVTTMIFQYFPITHTLCLIHWIKWTFSAFASILVLRLVMVTTCDDGNIKWKQIGGGLQWKQSDGDPGLIQMQRDFSVWSRITVSPWITMMTTMMIMTRV